MREETELGPRAARGAWMGDADEREGTVNVLFRLESDGDGDWERKVELAGELMGEKREMLERKNWILPEAPRKVKGFCVGSVEGEGE